MPAHAQLGSQAGFVEAFQPDFLNRDITLFVEFLGLEEWQEPIVESLLIDYSADFRVGTEGMRDEMKGMKDQIVSAGEQGAMGVIMGPINRWTKEKARLKQRFIDNFQSVLSEEQRERWPQLERAMRREKELPRGLLSGESVDLRQVARECEIPPDAMLVAKEALEAYELELDAALLRRVEQMERSQDKIKDSMVQQNFAVGLQELELIVATRIALRELQDRSIETLTLVYGEQWGPTFRTRALAKAYPAVFRPSPMIPYFAEAKALPGLSADQVDQLNALEVRFVANYEDWRLRLAASYRQAEPLKLTETARRQANREAGQTEKPPRDPHQALNAERDQKDAQTRDEIAAIVGEELALQLPGAAKMAAATSRPMGAGGKDGARSPGLNAATEELRGRLPVAPRSLDRPAGSRDRSQSAGGSKSAD